MARNTWNIEKKNGSYANDGTIYRPNDDVSVDLMSTQNKSRLANGSNVFVTPETKVSKQPLSFVWLEIPQSDSFRTKIEAYVTNGDYLRITTHLSETFIGRFINVQRVWLSGKEDTYDLQAAFERME